MYFEMKSFCETDLAGFSLRRLSFSPNLSVLCIGEEVRKFWFLLTYSSVTVAVRAWFTIIFGVASSRFSLRRLVGRRLLVLSLCFL